jgi:hypothetical protein
MRHRLGHKRHLSPCIQLFGFNGLIVTPVGRWGEGLFALAPALRCPPLLASRPGGFREDGGRELPARPCWRRVVYTCRDGAGAPLEGGCNNFCFCKVLFEYYLSSSISTYLHTICPYCVWHCRLLSGTWPP